MHFNWDGLWDDGWMSWSYLHNVERFDVTKEQLDKDVSAGLVDTKIINNHNNPGKNTKFLAYWYYDLIDNYKRKPPKPPKQKKVKRFCDTTAEEQVDYMDEYQPEWRY